MQKNELYSLIQQSRTVHTYVPHKVDLTLLKECLSISLMAPNHRLSMPWRFKLVGNETRLKLAQIQMELKGRSSPEDLEKTEQQFLAPSFLLVPYLEIKDDHLYKEDYATMSCTIQLLALNLRLHGLGYKWSTGKVTRDVKTYQVINIDQAKYQIEGWIWIGKVDGQIPSLTQRPEIDSILEIID